MGLGRRPRIINDGPVIFDATWGCPACRLRFPASDRCPECGNGPPIELATAAGRERFWRRARGAAGSARGPLFRLRFVLARAGDWTPQRPWIVAVVGLLLFLPAPVFYLRYGVHAFHDLYIVTQGGKMWTEYRFSSDIGILAMSAAGAVLLLLWLLAVLASSSARRIGARDTVRRLRVPLPPEPAAGATPLRGRVRGDATLESPVSERACIVFGLQGDANGSPIDDAMGADFELETGRRERVFVELDHAVLEVDAPGAPAPTTATGYLAELIADRGLDASRPIRLVEHVLCDGDAVSVEGKLHEEPPTQSGYRDAIPTLALRGTPSSPLRIRKLASGSAEAPAS